MLLQLYKNQSGIVFLVDCKSFLSRLQFSTLVHDLNRYGDGVKPSIIITTRSILSYVKLAVGQCTETRMNVHKAILTE